MNQVTAEQERGAGAGELIRSLCEMIEQQHTRERAVLRLVVTMLDRPTIRLTMRQADPARTQAEIVEEALRAAEGKPLTSVEIESITGLPQSAIRAVLYGQHRHRFVRDVQSPRRIRWQLARINSTVIPEAVPA